MMIIMTIVVVTIETIGSLRSRQGCTMALESPYVCQVTGPEKGESQQGRAHKKGLHVSHLEVT